MLQVLGVKARVLRAGWVSGALLVALGSAFGAGAALWRRPAPAQSARAKVAVSSLARLAPPPPSAEQECQRVRAQVARLPSLQLPVTALGELRAQLLGRTKGVPVLFLSAPPPDAHNVTAKALRELLEASPGHQTFGAVVGKVRQNAELARAVFLRDGYLYTESPELAVLYGSLTLPLLFRDPELRIVRGQEVLRARRLEDGDYEYTSGDERGRRAKLLLFDRIAQADAELASSRHVDMRALAGELGFDELAIIHATPQFLDVIAHYGAIRVPTLLRVGNGRLSLVCEMPGRVRAGMQAYRAEAARSEQVQARLVSIVKEQMDEALPFDESKTEDGQQDGKLRPEWRSAYLNGSSSFEFNGDRYAVFDQSGRPRPPQVCIDFVLDTFERAGGSWWKPRGEPRERAPGRLRFDDSVLENRRSVERFIEFARAHPEAFEVYDPPAEERVSLRNRSQFLASVYKARAHFRRGDVVAILGPRDDEKLHYHSFIIVGSDPLSGMPIELAANAGRPRIRSWEGEMSNAPRRSIFSRVRPRQLWLESFLLPEGGGFGPAGRQTDAAAEQGDGQPASPLHTKGPAAG